MTKLKHLPDKQQKSRMGITPISGHDLYTWVAIYEDGTAMPEYDDERPDGRGWADVDATRVSRLLLVGMPGQAVVALPSGATPVFFRRRVIEMVDCLARTIHCIGWKREREECYLFLFEDGSSLLTADLQAV